MCEKQRILKTLSDLYDGSPWTDLSILGVVGDLTAEQASAKPIAQMHSVWEYLNHIIYWRMMLARIMSGQAGRQEGDVADFEQIGDTSEAAWRETLSRLERCQETFMGVVSKVCDGKLDALDQSFRATYYELIQGTVQHDAYHLGQAMIVKKIVASAGRIIV
jgi:uncharacterized damage-inducible protein DinB